MVLIPKQMCSSSDVHWILLGFTDANGQHADLFGIIFKAESFTPEERLSYDIFESSMEPCNCITVNCGKDKRLPDLPRYISLEALKY